MTSLKQYKYSWLIIAIILYFSLFTIPKTELDEVTNIDKLVHICMYGSLCTVIWIEYLRSHTQLNWKKALVGATLLPILLSGIIELLQEYATTNRSGDWEDMIANSIGALAAIATTLFRSRLMPKEENP